MRTLILFIAFCTGTVYAQINNKPNIWLRSTTHYDETKADSLPSVLNYHAPLDFQKRAMLDISDQLNRENTFFMVFRKNEMNKSSDTLAFAFERPFAEFHYRGSVFKADSYFFKSTKAMRVQKGSVFKGVLLSYAGAFAQPKKLRINQSFIFNRPTVNVYEVMTVPSRLNLKEQLPTLTYLALKYGVSLEAGVNYKTYDEGMLWDVEKDKSYANRITGLAREDHFGLYQKQTQNSKDSLMGIGLGSEYALNAWNPNTLDNSSYLVYGDDGGAITFEKVEGKNFKRLERSWRFYKHGSFQSDSLYLKFDLKQIADPDKEESFYLHLSQSASVPLNLESLRVKKGIVIDSVLYFKGLNVGELKGTEGYWSLYKRDRFELKSRFESDCERGDAVILELVGGTAPYEIQMIDAKGVEVSSVKGSTKQFRFGNLPEEGALRFQVLDATGAKLVERLTRPDKQKLPIGLEHLWFMEDEDGVMVSPTFEIDNRHDDWQFEWWSGNTLLSTEPTWSCAQPGSYALRVFSRDQCLKLPFEVLPLNPMPHEIEKGEPGIYPNPVVAGEPFTIKAQQTEKSDIYLSIYTLKGQFLYSKTYTDTDYIAYQNILDTPGMYLVLIKTAKATQVVKLIVKNKE